MGFDTPMAISTYLAILLAMLFSYPFVVVGISIAVFGEQKRTKFTSRFNLIFVVVAMVMLVLHLQTEVYYGKELLDMYYVNNPDKIPN
ncbi:hypothetical protein [Vibrio paucivorans]|uniref:Uncharacterized protein n=1 Tax=Vibrio paucivorans TaxID=2829489 RepID=A0A9X3CF87_9VIBR|nr:hypothetical protein [Vibrio paucivorans]MCW8334774.1 hypothetical protein [Vibrio paucivorans]